VYTVVDAGHGILYSFLIVATARLFNYRIFLHHHSSSYTKVDDVRVALLGVVAGNRATHIALSDEMAQDLKTRYRSCRQLIVVSNAGHVIDPGAFEVAHRGGRLTLGFLSNLSLEKGLDIVLRAFEEILSNGMNVRLILAGPVVDGSAQDLIDKSRQEFGGAICYMGPVSGDTKQAFFKELDLFLFPSRYRCEAQPLVVLEALSYGIPALVTRHGYSADIVGPSGTATDSCAFVVLVMTFARQYFSDPLFGPAQRRAARSLFLELAEKSRRQVSLLVSLLMGEQVDIHRSDEAITNTRHY